MQSLLSSHGPQAIRKPCLNSLNRVHGHKLVSVEGGDSKRSNFGGGGGGGGCVVVVGAAQNDDKPTVTCLLPAVRFGVPGPGLLATGAAAQNLQRRAGQGASACARWRALGCLGRAFGAWLGCCGGGQRGA